MVRGLVSEETDTLCQKLRPVQMRLRAEKFLSGYSICCASNGEMGSDHKTPGKAKAGCKEHTVILGLSQSDGRQTQENPQKHGSQQQIAARPCLTR